MQPQFYYPDVLPALNDIVIADIQRISDVAVYGILPAYGDVEVMLPTSEINVKRHKRVSDYIRVGQTVPLQVIRIEAGPRIDASMKQVRADEATTALETYHRQRQINLMVRSACEQDQERVTAMYRDVVWPLGEDVWTVFEEVKAGEEHPEVPTDLQTAIHQRMPMPSHTATAEITLRFGSYHDGVQRLMDELNRLAALEGVEVFVVAPPKYRLVVTDKTKGRAAARLTEIQTTLAKPC